jgi:hypothetical protein
MKNYLRIRNCLQAPNWTMSLAADSRPMARLTTRLI